MSLSFVKLIRLNNYGLVAIFGMLLLSIAFGPQLIGKLYLNLGNVKLSKAVIGKSGETTESLPHLLSPATTTLARDPERLASAIDLFQRSIGWNGSSHAAFLGLGKALLVRGEPALAIDELSRARELAPPDSAVALELGNAFWQSGDTEKARSIWREAGLLDKFFSPYYSQATRALEAKDYAGVERWVNPVLAIDQDDPLANYLIARVFLAASRWQEARDSLGIVVKSYSSNWWGASQSFHYLGVAYKHLGDLPSALQTFEEALKISPSDIWSLLEAGHVSIGLQMPQQAINYYARAREVAPSSPLPHFYLAKAFENSGQLDGAMAELKKAIELDPKGSDYRVALANLYIKTHHTDEAAKEFNKALEVDPRNETALKELGRLGKLEQK